MLNSIGSLLINNSNIFNNKISKSMQRLSTGLKLNSASDDAAGLTISEKMKAQIAGLNQASSNIQDGVSLLQTIQGGLSETTSCLQKIRQLCVQSANGTNNTADQTAIQTEIDQLKGSINNIADSTDFNGITPLNMTSSTTTSQFIDLSKCSSITVSEVTFAPLNINTFSIADLVNGVTWQPPGNEANEKYIFSVDLATNTFTSTALGRAKGYIPANNINCIELNGITDDGDTTNMYANTLVTYDSEDNDPSYANNDVSTVLGDGSAGFAIMNVNASADSYITVGFAAASTSTTKSDNNTINIQMGDKSEDTFGITLKNMTASDLGISDLNATDSNSISTIDSAIALTLQESSKYGADENTLNFQYANTTNMSNNVTDSDSNIEDCDMAQEVMDLAKNKILSSAVVYLMQQAQSNSGDVLKLLQV